MNRLTIITLVSLALALCSILTVAAAPPSHIISFDAPASSPPSSTPAVAIPAPKTVTAYTLPPDRYQKARDLSRIRFRLAIIGLLYGLVVLWLILRLRLASTYREWAERVSPRLLLQALIFSPLLILTVDVLEMPIGVYRNWISRRYGISVQGWRSWSWDWTKGEFVSVIVGTLIILMLYVVIRRSPRRWWFYFWLFSIPFALFGIFLQPLIVDPLFHKFEPLATTNPALTGALQKMIQRAGENIPPDRMFLMGAAEKSTALNAYVTGIGGSKRMVVWDTTVAKLTTPQIVFVAGHETGHYVLHHIPKLIAFNAALFFAMFYLGFRCVGWILARWGPGWGIRGIDDLAALPVLLVLVTIFGFALNPLSNAVTRHYEHQADQFGLEVTHDLTPDSSQVAAQTFQTLGDIGLADPAPNPLNVFLFYDHPTVPDRIRYALTYDPWSSGGHGQFVR